MALWEDIRRLLGSAPVQQVGAEWSVFHGDEHVCDLVEPAFADMFWVSYRMEPRVEADRMFMILDRALIDPRILEFRRRSEPHDRAKSPFLGGGSVRTMRDTWRVGVRALC